jgi:hypothetical protein
MAEIPYLFDKSEPLEETPAQIDPRQMFSLQGTPHNLFRFPNFSKRDIEIFRNSALRQESLWAFLSLTNRNFDGNLHRITWHALCSSKTVKEEQPFPIAF